MKCVCGNEAVIYLKYASRAFCKKCLVKWVEIRISKNIRTHNLISAKERIGVAFSGGKDSALALHYIAGMSRKIPLDITAISVDEGIKGYRKESLRIGKKLCRSLGIRHEIVSFKELFGSTLDRLVRKEKARSCSFCGVLRRKAINSLALKLKLEKVVTGHNLDDESQVILMNYLRGDATRLARGGARTDPVYKGLVPRVKILRTTPERESMLYCILKGIEIHTGTCPYAKYAMRNDIRKILDDFELKYPGTKFAVLKGNDRMLPLLKNGFGAVALGNCLKCGGPTSGRICKVCEVLSRDKIERS